MIDSLTLIFFSNANDNSCPKFLYGRNIRTNLGSNIAICNRANSLL